MKFTFNFSTLTDEQFDRLLDDIAAEQAELVCMTWRYTTSCGTLGLNKYAYTVTPLEEIMKYKQALERITQQFVSINYDELSTLEHAILREATVALGWSVVVKGLHHGGEDREIQLEKNQ